MNCVILAKGEKSKRLGMEKPFLIIKGKTLIDIVIGRIKDIFGKIYIVSTTPDKFNNFKDNNVFVLDDKIKSGPLGGIYIGLINSETYYNFVLGIDLVFINRELIKYMVESEKKYDIFIPKTEKYIQPLCGIYSKRAIGVIKDKIQKGDFKVTDIFKHLNVKFLVEEEMEKFGNPEILFFNMNTEYDVERAKYIWEKYF